MKYILLSHFTDQGRSEGRKVGRKGWMKCLKFCNLYNAPQLVNRLFTHFPSIISNQAFTSSTSPLKFVLVKVVIDTHMANSNSQFSVLIFVHLLATCSTVHYFLLLETLSSLGF